VTRLGREVVTAPLLAQRLDVPYPRMQALPDDPPAWAQTFATRHEETACRLSAIELHIGTLVRAVTREGVDQVAQIRSAEAQIARLQREKIADANEYAAKLTTINSMQARISELEKKLYHPNTIGVEGESDVLKVLDALAARWGDGFVVRSTRSVAHSGDFVVDVTLPFQSGAMGGESLKIVIDSKRRTSVSRAHFEQAIRDAQSLKARAVVVVYGDMGKRSYPRGICEGDDVNRMLAATATNAASSFDSDMVKGCTVEMIPVALSKILFNFSAFDPSSLSSFQATRALCSSANAYASLLQIVAPILKSIDLDAIKDAAAVAQKKMLALKQDLCILVSAEAGGEESAVAVAAANHLAVLESVFPRTTGGRVGATTLVLGAGVHASTTPAPLSSPPRALQSSDEEAKGCDQNDHSQADNAKRRCLNVSSDA
tara:strand:- start:1446 stop:2735 length:1290 start_codon:yes stop_codon:yes gene_type:complete